MSILNKQIADTLCTMIALGFLADYPDRKKIVYEEKNEAQHNKLQKFINDTFKLKVTFKKCEPKTPAPFIVALKENLEPEAAKNINDDLSHMAQHIETNVNSKAEVPLFGAYIGGIYDTSKLQLLGPSDLWSYDPKFRSDDIGKEVEQAYEKAKVISNKVEKLLDNPPLLPSKICYEHLDKKEIKDGLKEKKLFASVHGMIRAIFHYATDNKAAVLELALGKDTCKVASCIPCALFMEAVKSPASAIHLGRGDNWNFPAEKKTSPMYKDWKTGINYWLQSGITICRGNSNTKKIADDIAACTTNYDVPEMFLEALTYESSFIDKMFRTFGI